MGRAELPAELTGGPFAVARARELGLRAGDLRHRGLHRPTRGVRTSAAPDGLVQHAQAFSPALPAGAAFSHVTAALLHGIPVPVRHERSQVLDVMGPSNLTPTRRIRCRGHKGLESREVVVRSGVRLVGPADTWCDLAGLRDPTLDVDDLVVAGDAVVAASAAATAADPVGLLARALDRRVRPRGARSLAEALALVRLGVRSPMETRARLMFVRAGFPEPEVNGDVKDGTGGWLLEGDLVWRGQRVVGEYQGSDHADRGRRSRDAHRSGLAGDEGWTVLEIWAEDVLRPARRRTTLRRFARELGLDPRDLSID